MIQSSHMNMTLTETQLDDLETKAKAATPGPWDIVDVDNQDRATSYRTEVFIDSQIEGSIAAFWKHNADADYLAACSPKDVGWLL